MVIAGEIRTQADQEMVVQFERIIRRVKHSMNYRGSYSTRDILGSLVARWVSSGEWQRLKELPSEQRHIGSSVRRFILDRLDQLRRRGDREELHEADVVLPDEATLAEIVELAELRCWIDDRVGELELGRLDPRAKVPLPNARQVGQAMRLYLTGLTQRQIAAELVISLGAVNKRLLEGTNYLILVQGIEAGIEGLG